MALEAQAEEDAAEAVAEAGDLAEPAGAGRAGNHRYNLTFSVSARNIFNNVNLATPIGNLSSPLFGQSNGLASGFGSSATANRQLTCRFRLISNA